MLVSCVDDNTARLFVSQVATRGLQPHLDIGTGVVAEGSSRLIGADIRLVVPGDGCLLCIGGVGDMRQRLERLVAIQQGIEPPRLPWDLQRLGSLRSVNQMAVAVGMRLLETQAAGESERSCWLRIEWEGHIPQSRLMSHDNNPSCPLCRLTGRGGD